MRKISIYWVILLGLLGCGTPSTLSREQYAKWISDIENGLSHYKEVNKVQLNAKFLPSEYLAYREYNLGTDSIPFDSVWADYKCGLAFQVTLSADKNDRRYGNLMYFDVETQNEISARIQYLSFNISDFMYLKHNEDIVLPVLSNFEGFDQLGNKASFLATFIVPDYQCGSPADSFGNLTLVFDDPYWDLGTNQFEFKRESIVKIPGIKK